MKIKVLSIATIVSFLVVAVALAKGGSWRALTQREPSGRMNVLLTGTDLSLKSRPAMVSAIKDGRVISQYEVLFGDVAGRAVASTILEPLPPGVCDVRVEGGGIITEVKRGAQVFSGRDGVLQFVVRPGKGVHVVEYATGGLSSEEIAARIDKLEAAVGQLQKLVQSK